MQNHIDLTKVDLSKLLPPPGVPCRNEKERDLMVALHNAKIVQIEVNAHRGWTDGALHMKNELAPDDYRLAPPPPMRFERVTDQKASSAWVMPSPNEWVHSRLCEIGKDKQCRVTIVVEEVRE